MLKLGVLTILAQGFFADIIPIDLLIFITGKERSGKDRRQMGENRGREQIFSERSKGSMLRDDGWNAAVHDCTEQAAWDVWKTRNIWVIRWRKRTSASLQSIMGFLCRSKVNICNGALTAATIQLLCAIKSSAYSTCKTVEHALLTKRSGNQVLVTAQFATGYYKIGPIPPQCLQNGCGIESTASTLVLRATKSLLQKDTKGFRT